MKLTATIYTTDKKSFVKENLPEIQKAILTAKGVEIGDFVINEIDLRKDFEVKKDGIAVRPNWDWVQENYKTDGNLLVMHISKKDHDTLGLRHPNGGRLGGTYNRNIGDDSMEFMVIADRNANFVLLFLHELSHGFSHWSGVPDFTHSVANTLENMKAIYKTYDFTRWNEKTSLIEQLTAQIKELLKKITKVKETPHKMFDKDYPITQSFGVLDARYTQTQTHIGTDFGTPLYTPIYAPFAGVATKNFGTETGIVLDLKTKYGTFQFIHMNDALVGDIKKGQLIGFTGNTGSNTTGPHCCVRLWKDTPNISILTRYNIKDYLQDVTKLYV